MTNAAPQSLRPRAEPPRPARRAWLAAAGVSALAAAVYVPAWRHSAYQAEQALVVVSSLAALGALAVAAVRSLRPRAVSAPTHEERVARLDAALVLGVSLLVRLGLTSTNIVTDGGSGFDRVVGWTERYSGLSVLLRLLLPGPLHHLANCIEAIRLLAALAPALLVLLGGALGAGRSAALLAGLCLACWPVHAALFSTDSLEGAMLTLQLLGFVLVARDDRPASWRVAGLLVLAFSTWCRPEAPIVAAPLLALLAARGARPWRWHPAAAAAGAWFGLAVLAHLAPLQSLHNRPINWHPLWEMFPLTEALRSPVLLPAWIWAPLPVGLVALGRRSWRLAALVGVGLAAGFVPAHIAFAWTASESYTEVFRYGAQMAPWLALAAGAGLAALASLPARLLPPRAAPVALALVALPVLATPLYTASYLARRYGPREESAAFREALARVPERCAIAVPDDEGYAGETRTSLQVLDFYRWVAREARLRGAHVVPFQRVAPASAVLELARRDGRLPDPREVDGLVSSRSGMPPSRVDPPPDPSCWYFFRGAQCYGDVFGHPQPACRALEHDADGGPVWRRVVEFRSYRLITRPGRRVAPWYLPALEFALFRLRAPR